MIAGCEERDSTGIRSLATSATTDRRKDYAFEKLL
jgi:hypothetical protein